jgi:hypothetical protein
MTDSTRHDAREARTGRYAAVHRCDFCGSAVGSNAYYTDDEVCQGGDGPGFILCGRKACVVGRDALSVSTRRELYTAQRALNVGAMPLRLTFRTHGVLAGAYLGGARSNPNRMLTHTALGDDLTPICGRIRRDMLCDVEEEGLPTCAACLRHMLRLGA